MIKNVLRYSLPTNAWAAVFAIFALCVISAISSGMLAWISETDAETIDTAGSIRMTTYRINFQLATDFTGPDPADNRVDAKNGRTSNTALEPADTGTKSSKKMSLLITDMEQRLEKLRNHLSASKSPHEIVNNKFKSLETEWLERLKPALLSQDKQTFYTNSLQYVENTNELVNELQYRNEQRQSWQMLLQIASLVLTVFIMFIGIRQLQNNVLIPVQQLIRANSKFKQGKRDVRVAIAGYSEFNELGNSFNEMAQTIDSYQCSLEHEVQLKTQHLVKANQALSLLYEFAQHLTTSQLSLHKLDSLITDFGKVLPHLELTLCLQNDAFNHKDSIALHSDNMQELCTKLTCDNCGIKKNEHTKSYLIAQQNIKFGELRVRPKSMLLTSPSCSADLSTPTAFKADKNSSQTSSQASNRIPIIDEDSPYFQFENDELITTLTSLVSTALSLRKQRQQEYQLVLFEERTTIARELHDSLAQSLSYLKIQISVLEKHLNKAFTQQEIAAEQKVWAHIEHIKMGLKSAYQELRDLLVTFRLTIDNDNFDEALHESASEFALKGDFNVTVNNKVMTLNLTAAEQVDLIQIAREALSNISRHAHATNVAIDFGYNDENTHIVMAIIDDGVGIAGEVDQSLHHGLMIMEERAHSLGGILVVTKNEPKGTIIAVKFAPDFFNPH